MLMNALGLHWMMHIIAEPGASQITSSEGSLWLYGLGFTIRRSLVKIQNDATVGPLSKAFNPNYSRSIGPEQPYTVCLMENKA